VLSQRNLCNKKINLYNVFCSISHYKNFSIKINLHNCNIFPSVPTLHDIDWLILAARTLEHVTQFVQLARSVITIVQLTQSVIATAHALYNAAGLLVRCKDYWYFWREELLRLLAINTRLPSIYFPKGRRTSFFSQNTRFLSIDITLVPQFLFVSETAL